MDSFIVAKKNKALLQNNLIVKLLKKKGRTMEYVVQYQRYINTLVCIYVYVYVKNKRRNTSETVDTSSFQERNRVTGNWEWRETLVFILYHQYV